MDSLIAAAARALAAGDLMGALNRVALRDDPPALALRGIVVARLGDLDRARGLLRRAARAFGSAEAVAHARCVVAEAEIALVSRDLGAPVDALAGASTVLEAHGDRANAAHARQITIRYLLLLGWLDAAEQALRAFDAATLSPAARAVHELMAAGIAMRRVRAAPAREALERAARAAHAADIPALSAEVEVARAAFDAPAARLVSRGTEDTLPLERVETLLASDTLVVDACRHVVRGPARTIVLAGRPVLFALARTLAEAWPGDAARSRLIAQAFRSKQTDESHRVRLRVEIARLRDELAGLADIHATRDGFALVPAGGLPAAVLAPPVDEAHGAVLALLVDGEAWSSSALALALGSSQRTVQRALDALAAAGRVHAVGRGRARRWLTPPAVGFTTVLLLPGPLPGA
ncbi:hypothetical protein STAQ_22730 [Allostella sp. ATCC 35155]|nr:hypothetical protein STAQ_22730 [Stella sp. ATCC 35155]